MLGLGQGIDFGPPKDPPIGAEERRHRELMAAFDRMTEMLSGLNLLVLSGLEREQIPPTVIVDPVDFTPLEQSLARIPLHEPIAYPSPEFMAEQIASRVPDHGAAVTEALEQVTQQLRRLGKQVAASAIVPSGGSSFSQPVQIAPGQELNIGNFPATTEIANDLGNPVPVALTETGLGLAKESSLQTIRDTLYRRTDPLPPGNNLVGRFLVELQARTLLLMASAVRTTGGTSAPFETDEITRIAVDVNVTAVSGTLSPSLRVFIDRQGADGLWYPIWSPEAITTVTTLSATIGQGMTIGQSLAALCRFRWEITGTSPSFTLSASVIGK